MKKYHHTIYLICAALLFLVGCQTIPQKTPQKKQHSPKKITPEKSVIPEKKTSVTPPKPKGPTILIPNKKKEPTPTRQKRQEPIKQQQTITLNAFTSVANLKLKNRILVYQSFVTRISLLPPFKYQKKNGQLFRDIIHFPFIENEKKLDGLTPRHDNNWRILNAIDSQNPEELGLFKLPENPEIDNSVYYGVANIHLNKNLKNINLHIRTNGFIKIWLNERLIFMSNRLIQPNHYITRTVSGITLKKGDNRLVIKTVKLNNQCAFSLHFTTYDEEPILFNTYHNQ